MGALVRSAVVATALAASGPAWAFMVVPEEDDPRSHIVIIETELGDHVPLAALPEPHDALPPPAPAGRLSFWWAYFRSTEEGRAQLTFAEDGLATMAFEFTGPDLVDGDTLGAAAVLVDDRGRALHSFYAVARVEGDVFEGGGDTHRISLALNRSTGWWRKVAGYTFFNMKYYAMQDLDREGVRAAMRRAVGRVTDFAGAEQWE